MDHHRILKELRDASDGLTEEQIIDGSRIAGQVDGAYRVDHSLPKMITQGLITESKDVVPIYKITEAGLAYLTS